jgi:[ribosomal protein S18]-alanine N-acetyltransferase
VRVRRATSTDIPAMMDLDRQSSSAAHWSQWQYEKFFVLDVPALPERFILVIELVNRDESEAAPASASDPAHRIIASLVAHRVDAEWELENIVVAETFRRSGVGLRLLGEFIEHVRAENGASIFLEVRESNQSARGLYRKIGFEETGVRKGYYPDTAEDAILCRLSLY